MSKRLRGLAIAAALTVAAPAAQAFPDAKVETQLRPCFGLLTDPAVAKRCQGGKKRHYDRGDYNKVYCDRARPGDVSRKLAGMPAGSTLYLVANTRACEDSLDITRSITIIGEGSARAHLQALSGRPCVTVRGDVRDVTLADLRIATDHAGGVGCIAAQGRDLKLDHTLVKYDGDASAITVRGGGLLTLQRDTHVVALSREAAVDVEGVLETRNASIFAARYGLRIAPQGDSRLDDLSIVRLDDWTGSERVQSSGGLVVRDGAGRLVQVNGGKIDGFSRGLMVLGQDEVMIERAKILGADWAVTSNGRRLRVVGSEIEAVEVGVYVDTGEAWVGDNTFFGVRRAGMYAESGARVRARDNAVYAHADGCQRLDLGGFNQDRSSLSCRPWYEAPEIWRNRRDVNRPRYGEIWS
ncbi:hypothetical protein [Caulobacter sp. 17J80-11]|uniref:hypothetical protein n=1 Tax=Caulobacter sp. 17J80-11 TaxID=2763502 RepID=UPI0016539324|nr:hypothetical protein [Caulobacter sp. 17J80-11]MBC6980542.1 hypothetical protein [Caulobacter sp. 17J80-11]